MESRETIISFDSADIAGGDSIVIYGLNMKVYKGDFIYIVGKVGTGKTSVIRTIIAENRLAGGNGQVCGHDLRTIREKEIPFLRRRIGVVFQDFQLPSLPLGENVAGATDYDREKAARCLADAGLTLPSDKLPQGLDTWLYKDLTEDGVDISGGEAQKIAIARALYKDAPFLILDEPTAALDPIAEAEIYSRLNDIVEDRTAVYISHRLSSCKFCDEIAVFEGGQIVQQGSHDALLSEENGTYSTLWHAQAQYYNE